MILIKLMNKLNLNFKKKKQVVSDHDKSHGKSLGRSLKLLVTCDFCWWGLWADPMVRLGGYMGNDVGQFENGWSTVTVEHGKNPRFDHFWWKDAFLTKYVWWLFQFSMEPFTNLYIRIGIQPQVGPEICGSK